MERAMKLRGIEFQPCWDAPGVRGWMGEGYWFHKYFRFLPGYDFSGSTRVGKTTTYDHNTGNMPFHGPEKLFAPKELFPKCIWFSLLRSETTNAVGLSGPGARALVKAGLLEKSSEPFMISFMSNKKTVEERLEDFRRFVVLLKASGSSAPYAVQINLSCPNTGIHYDELVTEGVDMLHIGAAIGVPLIVKYNIFAPAPVVRATAEHSACDAVCGTNAPPFDAMMQLDPPLAHHFKNGSPLPPRDERFGGGGYSGHSLLYEAAKWGRELRRAGIRKPINLGGGIRHPFDVDYLVTKAGLRKGVDSVFFASAAMIRPWQVQPIIRRAHELLG